jgi:hypothetical protein
MRLGLTVTTVELDLFVDPSTLHDDITIETDAEKGREPLAFGC